MKGNNATHLFIVICSLFSVLALVSLYLGFFTNADTTNVGVTIGNEAPTFTQNPAELSGTTSINPVDEGTQMTFSAYATDSNGENYYLAICKTNSVTPTNGGAPTCGGGSWCISSATTSGNYSSCFFNAQSSDAEQNDWYGFVCDGNASSAACSTSNQGVDISASPFFINHKPTFTVRNNNSAAPGSNITFTSTASDADTVGGNDTVKLIICTSAVVFNGDCAGTTLCTSSLTASDPTCNYTVPIPTPDTTFTYYSYIVDNHNLEAGGSINGTSSTYTVTNVAPSVSGITLNSGGDITLTESTTTAITAGVTVTDNNSCSDLSTVVVSTYRSGITSTGCDAGGESNANNCYPLVTCSVVGAGNTCTGSSDASADYTCTINMQYHADPTDTATIYTAQNWISTMLATDNNSATGTGNLSSGIEVLSLVAFDIDTSISFGSLLPGQSNDPLDKVTTVTATGNVGVDSEFSGTNLTSGPNSITVGNQKYSYPTGAAYAAAIALTASAVEEEINVAKTTTTGSPAEVDIYWGILIPNGTAAGSYTGVNTATVIKGETANW